MTGIGLVVAAVVDDNEILAGVAVDVRRTGDKVHATQESGIQTKGRSFHSNGIIPIPGINEQLGHGGAVNEEAVRTRSQEDVGFVSGGDQRTIVGDRSVEDVRFSQIVIAHVQAAQPDGGHLAAGPISIHIGAAIGGIAFIVRPERIHAAFTVKGQGSIDVCQ